MRTSATTGLWTLGILLVASGCESTRSPAGLEANASGIAPHASKAAEPLADVIPLGDFALYVPRAAGPIRGVLVTIGGPNTKRFVTGESFGAPLPQAEAALQVMGGSLRALAAEHRIAILGTLRMGMPNAVANDGVIMGVIADAADAIGRPELTTVPILLYGLSGGGRETSGFSARHPERVAGLFLRSPARVDTLTTAAQWEVPTFMVLSELDAFVDNTALAAAFSVNRGTGGLWGMAMERGVPHHALSAAQRQLTLDWLEAALQGRVNGSSGTLQTSMEQSGWLGDPSTGEVSPWGGFRGDRSSASWLPTGQFAGEWRTFIGVAP